MNLSAPTQMAFIIAVILAILALLGKFAIVTALGAYAFWLMLVAFGLLALACMVKGL